MEFEEGLRIGEVGFLDTGLLLVGEVRPNDA